MGAAHFIHFISNHANRSIKNNAYAHISWTVFFNSPLIYASDLSTRMREKSYIFIILQISDLFSIYPVWKIVVFLSLNLNQPNGFFTKYIVVISTNLTRMSLSMYNTHVDNTTIPLLPSLSLLKWISGPHIASTLSSF